MLADATGDLYRAVGGGSPPGEPRPDLVEATRGYLGAFASQAALWRCKIEACLQSPTAARLWLSERDRFLARIARNLRRGQRAGTVRSLDADLAAEALGSMVEWYAFTTIIVRPGTTDPEALDRAAGTLGALLHHPVHPEGIRPAAR